MLALLVQIAVHARNVRPHRRRLGEPLFAVFTLIRPLSRMDPHVNLRVLQRLEPLPAHFAVEWSISSVVHNV